VVPALPHMRQHDLPSSPPLRPRLRGVIHHYAFYASLVAGLLLVAAVPGHRTTVALFYGASLSALLGVSALYHRVTWSAAARRRMGRLDHSMINVLIAGTFTPFGAVAVSGTLALVLLVVVWGGAFANILLHLVWYDAPKWLSAASYVALGWVGVAAMPDLLAHAGWLPTALLAFGGALYSAGALVYALRRPDPAPTVFGYHEVFHALVVVAATAHYAAVALTLLPA
jgi:hemolysin III